MPNPRKVNVMTYFTGVMEPGDEWTFWTEPMAYGEVRSFIAEAQPQYVPAIIEIDFEDDKVVSVVDVFQITKGKNHTYDHTGGTDDLQVNVTFQNRSTGFEVTVIHVLMAETASN